MSLFSALLACEPSRPAPPADAPGPDVQDGAADGREGGSPAELGAGSGPNDGAAEGGAANEAMAPIDADAGASEAATGDGAPSDAASGGPDLLQDAAADVAASDLAPTTDASTTDSAADQSTTADTSLPDATNPDAPDLASDAGGCGPDQFRSDDRCISRVIAVATAHRGTCAVLLDGSAWCWGGTNLLTRPERVPGVEDGRTIAIGGDWGPYSWGAACVTTAGGRVLCWGRDHLGMLGDGMAGDPPENRAAAKPVVTADGQPLTGVRSVALGMTFGCANTASAIMCWGDNRDGQLGVPHGGPGQVLFGGAPGRYYRPHAAAVPGAPAAVIGAGYEVAIGADETGRACGWGWNSGGHRYWPVLQETPLYSPSCNAVKPVAQIVGGYNGACFLHKNEELACWGFDFGVRDLPGGRAELGPVRAVATGIEHVCALETSGRVFCWGRANDGQLGARTSEGAIYAPQEVKSLGTEVVAIGGGVSARHTCAIMRDGSLRCWGRNQEGQLGNAAAGAEPSGPVAVKW